MNRTLTFAAALVMGLCAFQPPARADVLNDMMSGRSAMKGKKLAKAIAAADAHPLGSEKNPVRAAMPEGQRAYLRRLRCPDGRAAVFERQFNAGIGVYGNIIDSYAVRCPAATPETSIVYLDMYHANHVEMRPYRVLPSLRPSDRNRPCPLTNSRNL